MDIEREIERVFLLFFIYTCNLLPNEHSTLSMASLDIGEVEEKRDHFFFFGVFFFIERLLIGFTFTSTSLVRQF